MTLRSILILGVAVTALALPAMAGAAEKPADARDLERLDTSNPCPAWQPAVRKGGDNLHLGSIDRSRCHVDHLRNLNGRPFASNNLSLWKDVRLTSRELGRLYDARAGRQQAWIDGASQFTGGSSLAYILSTGAGSTTLTYLGGAALLPVLASQFNAHEPTRDLFHAGALGVSLISARYEGLDIIRQKLAEYERSPRARSFLQNAEAACVSVGRHAQDIQARVKDGAERTALAADLKALQGACSAFLVDMRTLAAYQAELEVVLIDAPQLYAGDVVTLDSLLLHADRQLRTTPLKTLTMVAASPFNSASTLLTGDDGRAAVATLKAQEVFGDLKVNLSPIGLGPAPKMTSPTAILTLDSLTAIEAASEKVVKPLDRQKIGESANVLRAAVRELNAARPLLARQFDLSVAADALAASTLLEFSCEVSTRKVNVVLDRPKPPPTIIAK